MAEFPSMPFFFDVYFAATRHLTDAEHGVYLQVLGEMWMSPEKRLPNDIKWLSRKFRRTVSEAERTILPILNEFCQCDGNWWTQRRLMREWDYCKKYRDKQSARAKSRWNKEKGECHGNATSGNAPNPNPNPKGIKETSEAKASSSKKSSKKRKSQIPEDWTPGRDGVDYAVKRCELPEHLVPIEAERFVNYHRAKGNTFADHMRAWQTWCRNYQQFNNRGANGRRQDEPYVNPHAQLVTEWVRELDQIPDDRDDATQGGDPGEPERKAIALH